MAKRATIPKDLAAKVMFASDRTCCVCRLEKQKCQIHHIDGNTTNNDFDNLAVLCAHCHIDVHSNIAFARNLTPELIRLYSLSWREIVRHKLTPATAKTGSIELAAEVFLEASLDCHGWKAHFMGLQGPDLASGREGQFTDVWDAFAELWVPKYTEDIYRNFFPLFDESLTHVQQRFDRLNQLFADVLPPDYRAMLVRSNRQLFVERWAYLNLGKLFGEEPEHEAINMYFYQRFIGVIRVLREIARDSDARREFITSSD